MKIKYVGFIALMLMLLTNIVRAEVTSSCPLGRSLAALKNVTRAGVTKHKMILFTENYPPYNMSIRGHDFEHFKRYITGYSTEIVKELMRQSGLPYRILLRNWGYAYARTQEYCYFGIYSTTRTSARENKFQWVGPIAKNNWVLYALKKSPIVLHSLMDAKKYIIGGYKGDAASEYLKSQGLTVSQLPQDRLNPKRLIEGEIDLWISGNLSAYYLAKKMGVTNLKPIFTVKKTKLYIAFNKRFPKREIKRFQSILDKMRKEGYLDAAKSYYR